MLPNPRCYLKNWGLKHPDNLAGAIETLALEGYAPESFDDSPTFSMRLDVDADLIVRIIFSQCGLDQGEYLFNAALAIDSRKIGQIESNLSLWDGIDSSEGSCILTVGLGKIKGPACDPAPYWYCGSVGKRWKPHWICCASKVVSYLFSRDNIIDSIYNKEVSILGVKAPVNSEARVEFLAMLLALDGNVERAFDILEPVLAGQEGDKKSLERAVKIQQWLAQTS